MRENPVITDWARVSGGSTEGTLGRLAGAAAGGAQGMLAAGARSTNSCHPCRAANLLSTRRATNGLISHRDLSLERDCFLVVWIDGDRAQRILARLAAIAAFKKNPAE